MNKTSKNGLEADAGKFLALAAGRLLNAEKQRINEDATNTTASVSVQIGMLGRATFQEDWDD